LFRGVAPVLLAATLPPQCARADGSKKLGPVFIKLASPREIEQVFAVLAREPSGDSVKALRLMINTEQWDSVSNMAHLYDTFLRKDVMQPLSNRLKITEAIDLQDQVLKTFIALDRAAKREDKVRCLDLTDNLVNLIDRFVLLAPGRQSAPFRSAEASKLGLPATG
jgi:hypothetical protein